MFSRRYTALWTATLLLIACIALAGFQHISWLWAVIPALLVLLGFQLLGEALRALLHLPVPGPVIGMLLLAGALALRPREDDTTLDRTAGALLEHMGQFMCQQMFTAIRSGLVLPVVEKYIIADSKGLCVK